MKTVATAGEATAVVRANKEGELACRDGIEEWTQQQFADFASALASNTTLMVLHLVSVCGGMQALV